MIINYIGILKLCRRVQKRVLSSVASNRRRVRSKIDMDIKVRDNPVVVKLDSPQFKSIFTEEVLELKRIFDKYHYEIRVAGGAVRDLLMGIKPHDLDFATVATPKQMKDMCTTENIRMINVNGEKHGTITARIHDKENFEVTTLRIDMVTDGRHAEVEFTTDWKLDANRRDLTINSMFLGFDGSVYDYFYGYEDLQNRRVAFVGDPDVRVKEDYLRILRYFRFYGKIAERPDNHEENTLTVMKMNVAGLENISGERIWIELKKILEGNFADSLLEKMIDIGLAPYIGLPIQLNMEELEKVLQRSGKSKLHPMSYLVALLRDANDVSILYNRLKFSGYDRDMAYFLVEHRGDQVSQKPLKYYEKLVLNTKMKQKVAIEYVREVLKYRGEESLLIQFDKWDIPQFPVNGKILKDIGVPPGKIYGLVINRLKNQWIDSDYLMTAGDLTKFIPNILKETEKQKKK